MSIGDRLREERERLGLSQSLFADRAGVHRNTQARYEGNKRYPDSEYLSAIRELGVDDTYVLTGTRHVDQDESIRKESARELILSAFADRFGIDREEMDSFVELVDLYRTNEIARRSFNIGEEVNRMVWHMLRERSLHVTPLEIADIEEGSDLLIDLILRFESRQKIAQSKGIELTTQAKARAIAELYADARIAEHVDTGAVDTAIRRWAYISATGDRLSGKP